MATPPPVPVTPTTIDYNKQLQDYRNKISGGSSGSSGGKTNTSTGGSSRAGLNNPPPIKQNVVTLTDSLEESMNNKAALLSEADTKDALKGKHSWMGSIASKAGVGLLNFGLKPLLNTLDVTRRLVVSGLRESYDLGTGKQNLFESGKDFFTQVADTNLDSRKTLGVPSTGNKWLDGTIGFAIDVGLDPLTYLSLGTGTAAKIALKQVGKELSEAAIKTAAKELVSKSVKESTEIVAKQIAKDLGSKATSREIRVASRAAVAEGSKQLVADGVEGAAKKATQAASRYSAVGPRRTIGAGSREARATSIKGLKDEALEVFEREGLDTVEGRVANNFINAAGDDVIADIAKRGLSALTDDLIREMGISGGLRFGAFGSRTGLTTSAGGGDIMRYLGTKASGARQNLTRINPNFFGLRGMSPTVFSARTGLRTDRMYDEITNTTRELTNKETFNALETLAESNVYKQAQAAAAVPLRIAITNITRKEYRPYLNTVSDLNGVDLTKPLAEITAAVGRPVNATEVNLAKALDSFGRETADAMSMTGTDMVSGSGFFGVTNWFPEVLTPSAVRFLNSDTPQAKAILKSLGIENNPPSLGQSIANQLLPNTDFFKTTIPEGKALTIKQLNEAARDGGFKGDFFETNALTAIQKFGNKYKGDYAIAFLMNRGTKKVTDSLKKSGSKITKVESPVINPRTAFLKEVDALPDGTPGFLPATLSDELTTGTIDDLTVTNILTPWVEEDLRQGIRILDTQLKNLSGSVLSLERKESIEKAIAEIKQILKVLKSTVAPDEFGKINEIGEAWATLAVDQVDQYLTLFSKSPEQILKFLNNVTPDKLRSMVNLGEDAFVYLDSIIVPDALVRADVANVYGNIRKLKEEKYARPALQSLDAFTRVVKSWYTSTPAFHSLNAFSNWFQMYAGGAKNVFMTEGAKMSNNWNQFIKEEVRLALKNGEANKIEAFIYDNTDLVRKFTGTNPQLKEGPSYNKYAGLLPKNQVYAAENALLKYGGTGLGDMEDAFYRVSGAGKVGASGEEATGVLKVPFKKGEGLEIPGVSPAIKKVSETLGAVPARSRKVGNWIENHSRLIFTYDGIRQGLDPQEAIERTSKFLIDYSDLSNLDAVAKRFIPFWMFMSRNLPTQFVNMHINPGTYQKYNSLRRNFEDNSGINYLLPNYLRLSGATVINRLPGVGDPSIDSYSEYNEPNPTTKSGALYLKPDLGFPGAGSPSPIASAFDATSLADATKGLGQGLNPALKAAIELLTGRDTYTGQEMGGKEQALNILEKLIPPVSVASRYLNPFFAGTDNPVVGNLPGIYQSETGTGKTKNTSDNIKKLQAALSLFVPQVGLLTPNEENSRRQELIEALKSYIENNK